MGRPQFKELRRAYGFDEVAIVPGSVTVNPDQTSTEFAVDGITVRIPIIASAMDAIVSPAWTVSAGWPC